MSYKISHECFRFCASVYILSIFHSTALFLYYYMYYYNFFLDAKQYNDFKPIFFSFEFFQMFPTEAIQYPSDFLFSRKYLSFGFQSILQWPAHRAVGISHRPAIPTYCPLPFPWY